MDDSLALKALEVWLRHHRHLSWRAEVSPLSGDPGADGDGEGKSKRVEINDAKKI